MTIGGRRFLLGLAVLAASLCLALGIALPFIRLARPLFTQEHSLVSAVNALVRSSQFLLGAAVLMFGIFLPVLKFLYLVLLVVLPQRDIGRLARQLRALEWLGRWSLQDFLALSLAIALVSSAGPYDAGGTTGIYFFTAAVLLMRLAHAWLRGDVTSARTRAPAATRASAMRSLALVGLAGALFALGVTLPAVRLSSGEHSIATVVQALYGQQAYLPCAVIVTLALLLPGLRLFYLLALVASSKLPYALRSRSMAAIGWLGGHAVADTLLLALLAFYVIAPGRGALLPGAYCFAASVLVTMLAYGWAAGPAAATPRQSSLAERLARAASAPAER